MSSALRITSRRSPVRTAVAILCSALLGSLLLFLPPAEAQTVPRGGYNADGVAMTGFSVAVNGDIVSGRFTVTTNRAVPFTYLQIAVRDASGRNYDFARKPGVTVNGSRSFRGSSSSLPTGSYTAWVAYSLNGSGWQRLGTRATFTVIAVASSPSPFAAETGRPFAVSSAWTTPIIANPTVDSRSTAMIGYLSGEAGIANTGDYGVPVFNADANTPRYNVNCTMSWGTCKLEQERVPIPANAAPSPGTDGAMVIIDWSTRKAYEFWQYSWNGGSPRTSWGDISLVDGDGRGSTTTGAGISRLAGVVRTYEIRNGRIDHPLVFSTNNACQSVFRYPATKTDGASGRSDCIPEGARVQLDPSINVDSLVGLTAAERMVAKALQTHGAYNIDNGGARWAFIFETPIDESSPYPAVGLNRDYQAMSGIPWNRVRVLRQWDGA